jgi:hypothetical protein
MKIAAIERISVKLFKRPDPKVPFALALLARFRHRDGFVGISSKVGKELRRPRVRTTRR